MPEIVKTQILSNARSGFDSFEGAVAEIRRIKQPAALVREYQITRDVELYNLIATGTREGNVLEVLLRNFVNAANQLEGRMFDSLSLVGELVGLSEDDLKKVLSATFGNSEERARAMDAVQAITQNQLENAAKRAETLEASLRSTVDVAAAVAALQDEHLERINPAIVEAFLHRAAASGAAQVTAHAAGDGIFTLAIPNARSLPQEFASPGQTRPGKTALIATSGAALVAARKASADVSGIISLGPSEPPFQCLVALCEDRLAPDMFRGGALVDETSTTDYDLFCFQCEVQESGGKRNGTWSCLVRADAAGARRVRWEMLANLRSGAPVVGPPHPARVNDAITRAVDEAHAEQERRAHALDRWFTVASRELRRLPEQLTDDIADRSSRIAERKRLQATTAGRLGQLREISQVSVGQPTRVAWARVVAAAPNSEPTEKDSERISMAHVTKVLRDQGFGVADVHLEGLGYDLHASRGRELRLVEVKGVWRAASSQGIAMTGNEVLIATQHGRGYWLYVVDQCHDGVGTLYGVYPDPAGAFGEMFRSNVVVRVPGSALKSAREKEEHSTCA